MKHSVFSTCGALSFIACAAVAQTPQYTLETSAADSVPQTTIVPVQQAPVQVVEHTTVYEEPAAGMDRAQRRAYKARVYAAKIDSLVQSRDYMFFPNSMQEIPGGLIRSIYADYSAQLDFVHVPATSFSGCSSTMSRCTCLPNGASPSMSRC